MALRLRDFIPGFFSQVLDLGGGTTIDEATGNISLAGSISPQSASVIDANASTLALTAAQSGSIVLLDRAAGVTVTLPTCAKGLTYTFVVKTAVTSNAYKVITKTTASEFIIGGVALVEASDTNSGLGAFFDGSTDVAISSNGTTTGGIIGTVFTLTAISSTQLAITGVVAGSGTLATPAATS